MDKRREIRPRSSARHENTSILQIDRIIERSDFKGSRAAHVENSHFSCLKNKKKRKSDYSQRRRGGKINGLKCVMTDVPVNKSKKKSQLTSLHNNRSICIFLEPLMTSCMASCMASKKWQPVKTIASCAKRNSVTTM